MKRALLLLIFFPSIAFAQEDSLKAMLQYYPLQEGNYREYLEISRNSEPPFETDSLYFSIEVMGDTLLANGLYYKNMQYCNFYDRQTVTAVFERIDSASGDVFRYDTTSSTNEHKIDCLFATGGDVFMAGTHEPGVSGLFVTECRDTMTEDIFGIPTQIKAYDKFSLAESGYILARGLGLYRTFVDWDNGMTNTYLVYASIDGEEYGKKVLLGINDSPVIPSGFVLFQNYPNPFNPTTTIRYKLVQSGPVKLTVYNVLGQQVSVLADEREPAGIHQVTFNASQLASGVYFYTIQIGNKVWARKMLLMK